VSHPLPSPLSAGKSRALSGRTRVPGDKSISHRSLMSGARHGPHAHCRPAGGRGRSDTAKALQALGCPVAKFGGTWEVLGRGVGGLTQPDGEIDYGNSGTGLRLMMGVVAGHDMRVRFVGDTSLSRRPMGRILEPLMQMGLEVSEPGRQTLPLTIRGSADLLPIEYRPPGCLGANQVGGVIAGLHASGETTVIERQATRDHTERMLRHFGAELWSPSATEPAPLPSSATPNWRVATSWCLVIQLAAFLVSAALIVRAPRSSSRACSSTRRAQAST